MKRLSPAHPGPGTRRPLLGAHAWCIALLIALAACESDAKVNAAAEGIPVEEVEAEEALLDPTDGAEVVLPEGQYAYEAVHAIPETGDTMRLRGMLEIADSEAEVVEGRWHVPQLHQEIEGGRWTGEAYEITGVTTYPGRLVHRVRVADDGRVSCEAVFTWVAAGGLEKTQPAECSLDPGSDASAPGGLPTPDARPVRDADVPEPNDEIPD